jgi:glycosyltransferase involved in cell wall biosynthesis
LLALESSIHRRLGSYDSVGLFACPSNFLRDTMARGGIDPRKLRVLPNFVDVSAAIRKISPGGPVLYVGRLSEEKGVDVLLLAAQLLPPAASVRIVGDGPERSRLEAIAASGGGATVEFVGHVPPDEVRRHVAEASVLVVPSRCNENQPLAALEAFAAGVPVVGSEVGGLPELIRPGTDGLLVRPNDPQQLAQALASIMEDPDLALVMGGAGRRRVELELGPVQHLERVQDLYNSVSRSLS